MKMLDRAFFQLKIWLSLGFQWRFKVALSQRRFFYENVRLFGQISSLLLSFLYARYLDTLKSIVRFHFFFCCF